MNSVDTVYSSTDESNIVLSERVSKYKKRKKVKTGSKPKNQIQPTRPPGILASEIPSDKSTKNSSDTSAPEPSASQHDVSPSRPVMSVNQPFTSTSHPVTSARSPVASSRSPVTSDRSPVTSARSHVASVRSPVASASSPIASSSQPVTLASQYVTSTTQPTVSVDKSKPPPIHIAEVSDFVGLCHAIAALVGTDGFSCKSRLQEVMISPTSPDNYRAIIKYLGTQRYIYHTYQIKSEKAYRIAIRDLNAKTPHTEIKKDIEAHGHRVRAISNVLHHKTKVPLPLFFVDLEPASNNADIFCIKRIFYSSVRVEEPHKRQDIVQCTRCQQYRHTKGYCNRPPRCVRCGGEHESSTCSKSRDSAATCALCGGDHTANYKGCPAYKKLTTTLKNNTPKTNPPRAALDTYRPIPRPVAAGTPADALPPAPGAAPVGVTEPHVELSKTVNPHKIPTHPNLNKITYAQISTKETSKNSIPTSNTVRIPNPQPASPVIHSLPVPPVTTIPAASSNTAPSVVPVQLASALASFSNQFTALASELMAALTSLSSLLTTLTTVQLSVSNPYGN
ncbi:hypothetical protein AAG570_008634 [Ranatra chinensis]|uniref:Pre-C2HC domain-containing protein n=1 Tax=Ranatra chinensis TaxID=642074 RepID=A0ABD0YRI5_9HEMI